MNLFRDVLTSSIRVGDQAWSRHCKGSITKLSSIVSSTRQPTIRRENISIQLSLPPFMSQFELDSKLPVDTLLVS